MLRITSWIALTFFLVMAAEPIYHPRSSAAQAQDDWKAEFDDVCSKTVDATSLPKEDVRKLIERCDKLKPRIEKLDESSARVYEKRLKMCKDLFVFVLESSPK